MFIIPAVIIVLLNTAANAGVLYLFWRLRLETQHGLQDTYNNIMDHQRVLERRITKLEMDKKPKPRREHNGNNGTSSHS